jgi:hypothetical protein
MILKRIFAIVCALGALICVWLFCAAWWGYNAVFGPSAGFIAAVASVPLLPVLIVTLGWAAVALNKSALNGTAPR